MNDRCALHAIDAQLASRTPLERMQVAVGMLLDILPSGRTFALCDECERVIASCGGGQILRVEGES